MSAPAVTTFFAAPERAAPETLSQQHALLSADPVVGRILDAFPESAMILNHERQIVLANDKLCKLLEMSGDQLVGLRPGEVFRCVHASEPPAGCGTTSACRYCGGARSIVASQGSKRASAEECRILQRSGGALDLALWATPFPFGGQEFTLVTLRDTTDQHRRQVLERLFFHDVLNTAGGLRGILEIWPDLSSCEAAEMAARACWLSSYLIEEIQAQRALSAAESGDLQVHREPLDARLLLAALHNLYLPMAEGRGVLLCEPEVEGQTGLESDRLLLMRVLGNLIKNAIEASVRGQVVTVSFSNDGAPRFRVHNEAVLCEQVREQIFQRSFTTKRESGHGLGTYSTKLFTERYLGGTVSLTSKQGEGTSFTVELPPQAPA